MWENSVPPFLRDSAGLSRKKCLPSTTAYPQLLNNDYRRLVRKLATVQSPKLKYMWLKTCNKAEFHLEEMKRYERDS